MDIYDVFQPWLLLRLLWDPLQAELVGSMIPGAGQQSSKSEERKEKGQGSALSMSKWRGGHWLLQGSSIVSPSRLFLPIPLCHLHP